MILKSKDLKFFATTSTGLEEVLSDELRELGARNVAPSRGGVWFEGDLELMYRANMWLRTASRVLLQVKEFSAVHEVMLYDQIKRIKWEELLTPEMTFAVDCTLAGVKRREQQREDEYAEENYRGDRRDFGRGSRYESERGPRRDFRFEEGRRQQRGVFEERRPWSMQEKMAQPLTNSRYVSLKIKDAICDRIREFNDGARPSIDIQNPDLRIVAYIHEKKCLLSFDSSGIPLHERGYRKTAATAPLKENLAAAIIKLTKWDGKVPFYDPMCGSGTFSIEAAMIARNQAPGLGRPHFSFMKWRDFDQKLWDKVADEARKAVNTKCDTKIFASDQNIRMVDALHSNAELAGVDGMIEFVVRKVEEMDPPCDEPGVIVVNPPYGERLGDVQKLKGLYGAIGDAFKQKMKGWTAYIFTGNLELGKSVGLRTSAKIILHNGAIECRLLRYNLY